MNPITREPLGRHATILMGQSPPSNACSENGNGLPFIQGNAEFGRRYPTPRLRCAVPTRVAEAGDLLLSVRAPVGELNEAASRTVIGRGLSAIRVADGARAFAWHTLNWVAPQLNRIAQGSTFVAVSRKDVEQLEIPWTDTETCGAIAAVLDTLDEATAKTEAVIAKLRQVGAGLLHNLLTRGLDTRGQLRDPIAHPEQFRDSLLGQIPREWNVADLRYCLNGNPQNGIYKPPGVIGRGALLIGQTSITDDRSLDTSLARRVEVSREELDHYGLEEDDILISRVFATLEGVGQPALVPPLDEPAVFESNMMRLRVKSGVLAARLLFHCLRIPRIRALVIARANLSNQASVNQQGLNGLPIAIPTLPEQVRMLAAIQALDESAMVGITTLRKLQQLRSGLMTDLLTGRVRVPEDFGAIEAR